MIFYITTKYKPIKYFMVNTIAINARIEMYTDTLYELYSLH